MTKSSRVKKREYRMRKDNKIKNRRIRWRQTDRDEKSGIETSGAKHKTLVTIHTTVN